MFYQAVDHTSSVFGIRLYPIQDPKLSRLNVKLMLNSTPTIEQTRNKTRQHFSYSKQTTTTMCRKLANSFPKLPLGKTQTAVKFPLII